MSRMCREDRPNPIMFIPCILSRTVIQAYGLQQRQLLAGRLAQAAHTEPQQPEGTRNQSLAAQEKAPQLPASRMSVSPSGF